jgi:hypothetical protein
MQIGRIEEARNIIRIPLASPYAAAYPEWRETGDEIALRGWRPSRSLVSIPDYVSEQRAPTPDSNVVVSLSEFRRYGPEGSPNQVPKTIGQFSRVLDYLESKKLKKKQGSEATDASDDKPRAAGAKTKLNAQQLFARILERIVEPDTTVEQLEEILETVERLKSKEKTPTGET